MTAENKENKTLYAQDVAIQAAEIHALRAELAELRDLQRLFDLQHTRTVKADRMWSEAHNKPLVMPDLGALIDWLLSSAAKYGSHTSDCDIWRQSHQWQECTCGFYIFCPHCQKSKSRDR